MMRRSSLGVVGTLLITLARVAAADPADGKLGAVCASTEDCAEGLVCLPPESGLAGGLCTMHCRGDSDCARADPTARCAPIETATLPGRYCVESCSTNSWFGEGLDPKKCHGRADMGCGVNGDADSVSGQTIDWCVPFCATDAQCAPGLFCSKKTWLCESEPSEGDLAGSTCVPRLFEDTCQGTCVLDDAATALAGAVTGRCSEVCVIGSPASCPDPTALGLEQACLTFLGQGLGQGDLGGCAGLCNCSSECGDGFTCEAWDFGGDQGITGVCTPSPPPADATDCFDARPSPEPTCSYGPKRACKTEACVGTATCQPDGAYGECRCLTPIAQGGQGGGASDDAGEAGRASEAGSGSAGGAAGADSSETGPASPAHAGSSGCGCRVPMRRAGEGPPPLAVVMVCALLALHRARRRWGRQASLGRRWRS